MATLTVYKSSENNTAYKTKRQTLERIQSVKSFAFNCLATSDITYYVNQATLFLTTTYDLCKPKYP